MKGYQLISPAILEEVYHTLPPLNEHLIGISLWVINILKEEVEFEDIEIDFIIAEPHGNKCPTLAIHYPKAHTKDMGQEVSNRIEQIITNSSMNEYVMFLLNNKEKITSFLEK